MAWLTALVAVIAVWIAYQQYRTARHRLRLDLFERRMAVFEALMALVQTAIKKGDVELEAIFKFGYDTRQAEFLFDQPIVDYIDDVRKRAIRFRSLNDKLHEQGLPVGEERSRVVAEESALLDWFVTQSESGASAQFTSYLCFRNVR